MFYSITQLNSLPTLTPNQIPLRYTLVGVAAVLVAGVGVAAVPVLCHHIQTSSPPRGHWLVLSRLVAGPSPACCCGLASGIPRTQQTFPSVLLVILDSALVQG